MNPLNMTSYDSTQKGKGRNRQVVSHRTSVNASYKVLSNLNHTLKMINSPNSQSKAMPFSPINKKDYALNELKGYKLRDDPNILKQSISSFYNKQEKINLNRVREQKERYSQR